MFSANFFSALLTASAIFTLTACNNSEQTTVNVTDTTESVGSVATPNTTNSPSETSPHNMVIVRHKVANYSKWKDVYDGHDTARTSAGLHTYAVGRSIQDSNMVFIALNVDDTAKANAFTKDPGLKSTMQKGGVQGSPKINLVALVYENSNRPDTDLRSVSMFKVKDWNKWQQSFKEGEQERMDNGVVVRAYGHDAADKNKVVVITALVDSAKAVAYFKSDAMKRRMQAAEIIDQPDRIIYHVVQRY